MAGATFRLGDELARHQQCVAVFVLLEDIRGELLT